MVTTKLTEELKKLERFLEKSSVADYWQPGLTVEEIISVIDGVIDIHPPQEAIDWFGWHNGVNLEAAISAYDKGNPRHSVEIAPGFTHLSLESIVNDIQGIVTSTDKPITELWAGHELFPIASATDAGIHWLHRIQPNDPWTIWSTDEELVLSPLLFARGDPTLFEWVRAYNDAFNRGDFHLTEHGLLLHTKQDPDEASFHYPWD